MSGSSSTTGRSSDGAELTKYAQKVESFLSKPLKVPVDTAASLRQLQGILKATSFCSSQMQQEHFREDLVKMLRRDAAEILCTD